MGGLVPGVYVSPIAAQPSPSANVVTAGLIGIVGTATDGTPNSPTYFSNPATLLASLGSGTLLPNSLVREALSAMPEGTQFVGVRATDGTETSATMALQDSANAAVVTFVAIRPGSNANAGTVIATLKSGSSTASPIYNVTLTYPNLQSESYPGIVGYATLGGAYNAAAFIANLLAAINGTGANTLASKNWVATAGASTLAPVTGTTFTASGGTDGASGIASANLLGVPGDSSSRTGAYALAGLGVNFLIIAGSTDPSIVADLLAIAATAGERMYVLTALPQGSSPSQMVTIKNANSLTNKLLIPCGAWDYVFDTFSGTSLWVSPMGKIAGIIAGQDPEDTPLAKPISGATGVTATEATIGQGYDQGDQYLLYTNGIMYLSKPTWGNGLFKLPHGLASDGSQISDTRMQFQVIADITAFLANYIGAEQSVPPTNAPSTAADTDQTRTAVRNGAKALGAQYIQNGELQAFNAVCDMTNNISSTVLAGQLILNVYGTTFAGVQFAFGLVQVGSSVLITGPS
jgi:hypothetical protein